MKNNVDSEFNRIVIDTEIFDDRSDDQSQDRTQDRTQDQTQDQTQDRTKNRSDLEKIVAQARGAQKPILTTVQRTTTFTTWTTWTSRTIDSTNITSKVPQNKFAEPLPNYFRENHQWDIRTGFGNSDF